MAALNPVQACSSASSAPLAFALRCLSLWLLDSLWYMACGWRRYGNQPPDKDNKRKNILIAAEDIKKVNPLGESGLTSFII